MDAFDFLVQMGLMGQPLFYQKSSVSMHLGCFMSVMAKLCVL